MFDITNTMDGQENFEACRVAETGLTD